MLLLSGCGIRKKSLLLKLSPDMTKGDVELKMGKPEEIWCPKTNSKGDIIDIWVYRLGTLDDERWSRRFLVTLGCFALCPPLAFIPAACMKSEWDFDLYFLKFVNNFLSQWGRLSDLELPAANRTHIEK